MSLVDIAPWPRKRLSREKFEFNLVENLIDRACWRCGKYLGSMLYFDFGEKINTPDKRHGQVSEGECTIGVRDCYWELRKGDQLVIDSDVISDENSIEVLEIFNGQVLQSVRVDPGWICLCFSDDVILKLDTTNKHCTNINISELVMKNGCIFTISPRGYFYLSDEVSIVRFNKSAQS